MDIISENYRRLDKYFYQYDPYIGDKRQMCIERKGMKIFGKYMYLPIEFINTERRLFSVINKIAASSVNISEFSKLRLKYDFEFFCATCGKVRHKTTGELVSLVANYGQRKIIRDLEQMRVSGQAIEMVLLKSRQFGGSTIIEYYISWILLFHKHNWDAFVVALDMGQSRNIRQMFEEIVLNFPKEVNRFTMRGFGGMHNAKFIPERNCRITVGSSMRPDNLRSFSGFAMHLSECALWQSSSKISAEALAQSLWSIVPRVAYAIRIIESTAKGVGNFFHREFLSASEYGSNRKATFVSWFEIVFHNVLEFDVNGDIVRGADGIASSKIRDYEGFILTLSDYEKWMWEQGATLEGIKWYREEKRIRNFSDFQMHSEYPTTANEAFQSYANLVFEPLYRSNARESCTCPVFTGDIYADAAIGEMALSNIHLLEGETGQLSLWHKPDEKQSYANRYLVVVDIGGLSSKSDWSVISIFDRATLGDPFGALERAGTWRGHIDHDLLAFKAMQIARLYDNALLVIESNTLESRGRKIEKTYEGNHFYTVINEVADIYSNVYMRTSVASENVQASKTFKYGFHTNKQTKYAAYDAAKIALRNYRYIEHDHRAVDEMDTVQYNPQGQIEAASGYHDDIIDTIAIGIFVSNGMDNPEFGGKSSGDIIIDSEFGFAK